MPPTALKDIVSAEVATLFVRYGEYFSSEVQTEYGHCRNNDERIQFYLKVHGFLVDKGIDLPVHEKVVKFLKKKQTSVKKNPPEVKKPAVQKKAVRNGSTGANQKLEISPLQTAVQYVLENCGFPGISQGMVRDKTLVQSFQSLQAKYFVANEALNSLMSVEMMCVLSTIRHAASSYEADKFMDKNHNKIMYLLHYFELV